MKMNCMNERKGTQFFSVVFVTAQVAALLTGVVLNSLVLLLMVKNQNLRRKNLFLFNQVLADLMTGLLAPVAQILVFKEGIATSSLHACLFLCCLPIFLTSASLLSVCCISMDACLMVFKPQSKFHQCRLRVLKAMTVVVWSLAAVIGFMPMWWNERNTFDRTHRCFYWDVVPLRYNVLDHFFGFVVPVLTLIIVLHSLTFRAFLRSVRQVTSSSGSCKSVHISKHVMPIGEDVELTLSVKQLAGPEDSGPSVRTRIMDPAASLSMGRRPELSERRGSRGRDLSLRTSRSETGSLLLDLQHKELALRKAERRTSRSELGSLLSDLQPKEVHASKAGRMGGTPFTGQGTLGQRLGRAMSEQNLTSKFMLRRQRTLSRSSSVTDDRSLRLLKGLIMIVASYIACVFPINVFYALDYFSATLDRNCLRQVEMMLVVFSHFNAFINPLLYCLRHESFRKSLSRLLRKQSKKSNMSRKSKSLFASRLSF